VLNGYLSLFHLVSFFFSVLLFCEFVLLLGFRCQRRLRCLDISCSFYLCFRYKNLVYFVLSTRYNSEQFYPTDFVSKFSFSLHSISAFPVSLSALVDQAFVKSFPVYSVSRLLSHLNLLPLNSPGLSFLRINPLRTRNNCLVLPLSCRTSPVLSRPSIVSFCLGVVHCTVYRLTSVSFWSPPRGGSK
jgi:hypothetical protein